MRYSNLVWKETRETLPPLLLVAGFMVVYVLRPFFMGGLAAVDAGGFLNGLYSSGAAVLLFMAVVIGATAYAVEEEQSTLLPLLAKPIDERNIYVLKVFVRLGLLLAAALFFALLLVLTGAWGIVEERFEIGGFARWASAVALIVLGFGLGLYFGRTRKNQTSAVVLAMLGFGAGWVVLTYTSLRDLFQPWRHLSSPLLAVIRAVLIPLAFGLAAIALAAREQRGKSIRLTSGGKTAIAIVLYAGLLVGINLAFGDSRRLRSIVRDTRTFLALDSKDPLEVLNGLRGRLEQEYSAFESGVDAHRLLWFLSLSAVDLSVGSLPTDAILLRPPTRLRFAGYSGRVHPVEPVNWEEQHILDRFGSAWAARTLRTVGAQPGMVPEKLLAIHLMALAGDPAGNDLIASFLAPSREFQVRAFAALVLIASGDARGEDALVALSMQDQQSTYSAISWMLRVYPLPAEARPAIVAWLGNLGRPSWNTDLYESWLMARGGGAEDLETIRDIRWRSRPSSWRSRHSPADVDVSDVLLAWAGPDALPRLQAEAIGLAEEMDANRDDSRRINAIPSRERTNEDRRDLAQFGRTYYGQVQRLRALFLKFTELGDPFALTLWNEHREHLAVQFNNGGAYNVEHGFLEWNVLTALDRLGATGEEALAAVESDEKMPGTTRFQAAALLVQAGRTQYVARAIDHWRTGISRVAEATSEDSSEPLTESAVHYWSRMAFNTLITLGREGHPEILSALVDNAKVRFMQADVQLAHRLNQIGTWYWNTDLIAVLRSLSGRDFGWDIDAWSNWWAKNGAESATMPVPRVLAGTYRQSVETEGGQP